MPRSECSRKSQAIASRLPTSQHRRPTTRPSAGRQRLYRKISSGGREPVRQGILLLQVYWPIGAGLLPATEAAAVLRDAFKFNHRIDFVGGFIKVTSEPTIQGDIIGDNGYLLIPVTVPWQAFA